MRFKRYGRYEFADTPRRRAAFARKQRAERDALPLFAEQVAATQISADEEMRRRREQWDRDSTSARSRRAAKWIEARRKLRGYPTPVVCMLRARWEECRWPADPEYLLSMMHMYDTGRLVLPAEHLTGTG